MLTLRNKHAEDLNARLGRTAFQRYIEDMPGRLAQGDAFIYKIGRLGRCFDAGPADADAATAEDPPGSARLAGSDDAARAGGEHAESPAATGACASAGASAEAGAALRAAAPLRRLKDTMDAVSGLDTSVHLYVSGQRGSRAAPLHTDPYDVVVVQLNGTKDWQVCSPTQANLPHLFAGGGGGDHAHGSDVAHLNELHTTARLIEDTDQAAKDVAAGTPGAAERFEALKSKVVFDTMDLRKMECANFTMTPGERMYLPWGTLHQVSAKPCMQTVSRRVVHGCHAGLCVCFAARTHGP